MQLAAAAAGGDGCPAPATPPHGALANISPLARAVADQAFYLQLYPL